jgi:hypothetical protein
MIFLSDGECPVADTDIQVLCHTAVQLGYVMLFQCQGVTDFAKRTPLSFHSISFGPDSSSLSLRRMAYLALEIQNNVPQDSLRTSTVPSSFSEALDTVSDQLSSLQRGSLNVGIT